jgi:inner membrane protein
MVEISGIIEAGKNSQFLRILLIGALVLILQIPILFVVGLIGEREATRQEAIQEVTSKWGLAQAIAGPRIIVPYIKRRMEKEGDKQPAEQVQMYHASFLPENLTITGSSRCEERYRGIFKVPVFQMSLELKGQFVRPDFSAWGIKPEDVLWDRAELSIEISDARSIQNQAVLKWMGNDLPLSPGPGEFSASESGIHASLKDLLQGDRFDFSVPLKLNGSLEVSFAPFGRLTKAKLTSNWTEPSFQGNWLPSRREVSQNGFEAQWEIPSLGRNYPQQWASDASAAPALGKSTFGVRFITPVDQYRMASRSAKYSILFLALTFLALWLFEVLNSFRVHPIQYLLVGVAMCVFYLLELALSEHLGFRTAYLAASASVIALNTVYCVAVLKTVRRGAIIGAVLVVLYSYLYILLTNQDYALLVGSIGLLLVVAAVMYLTRKIDWYNLRRP